MVTPAVLSREQRGFREGDEERSGHSPSLGHADSGVAGWMQQDKGSLTPQQLLGSFVVK